MRSFLGVVTFLFTAVASAVSTKGNRLLVLLDDVAEKDGYAKFLGDLTGKLDARAGDAILWHLN
jgi:oligosaccharyltransferase complex subunit beta